MIEILREMISWEDITIPSAIFRNCSCSLTENDFIRLSEKICSPEFLQLLYDEASQRDIDFPP